MRRSGSGGAFAAATFALLAAASPAWALVVQVPAPPTVALVAVGAIGLAGWALWRRRK